MKFDCKKTCRNVWNGVKKLILAFILALVAGGIMIAVSG